MDKTQLGLGESAPRESVDPAIDHTVAQDPASRASASLVGTAKGPTGTPQRGDSIGRFVVLGVLGQGGMGVVYSGYDPHLDRKVAIKLLASSASRTADDARVRLLREAQAMAKINHPNVVKVHEVGTFNDQIYLAMEFANAGTVRQWLAREPRSQAKIIDVFIQAGHGLAAAHAAGLVHRDFKPDNVLMSKGDVAQVTDFGLVSVANAATRARTEPLPDGELSNTTPLSQDLTRTGSVMGTPIYMAPEQFSGEPATAATDQFSFCVALYEALYGARPFAGSTYAELAMNVVDATISPPPPGTKVPAAIRRALVRGLAKDPSQRHRSMGELLALIAPDPVKKRRYIALAIAGVLVATAVTAFAVTRQAGRSCGTGDDRIASAWNGDVRGRIEQAFTASNRPDAKTTFARFVPLVETWSGRWKSGYVDACRATRERGEQSEHMLDLRMQCLGQRLDDTRTTLGLLASGGGDAVDHALDLALALPAVAPCSDLGGLSSAITPPETTGMRASVTLVQARIDAARAEQKLGRLQPALATATAALVAARSTTYSPIVAQALNTLGEIQAQLAMSASAGTFEEAIRTAGAVGDTIATIHALDGRIEQLTEANRFEAAQELATVDEAIVKHTRPPADVVVDVDLTIGRLLERRGNSKEAEARYKAALAFAQRELGPESASVFDVLARLGTLYTDEGKFADARTALEQVRATREKIAGKDHPSVATVLHDLANVDRVEGKLPAAKELYERALAIRIAALGPDHPDVATSYLGLGAYYADSGDRATAQAYFEKALGVNEKAFGMTSAEAAHSLSEVASAGDGRGDHEAARLEFEHVRELLETAYGANHPGLVTVLMHLGVVAIEQHRLDAALAFYQRALQITEQTYGPFHPDVADALANIVSVYKEMHKWREAEAAMARSITVVTKVFGPDSPHLAEVLINYGVLQLNQDQRTEAIETYTQARTILQATLGKDHPYVAFTDLGLARALTDLHRPTEAIPFAEHALAVRTATDQPSDQIGEARFDLADALVMDPRTRARAISEAKQSLADYTAAKDERNSNEVKIWLRHHR